MMNTDESDNTDVQTDHIRQRRDAALQRNREFIQAQTDRIKNRRSCECGDVNGLVACFINRPTITLIHGTEPFTDLTRNAGDVDGKGEQSNDTHSNKSTALTNGNLPLRILLQSNAVESADDTGASNFLTEESQRNEDDTAFDRFFGMDSESTLHTNDQTEEWAAVSGGFLLGAVACPFLAPVLVVAAVVVFVCLGLSWCSADEAWPDPRVIESSLAVLDHTVRLAEQLEFVVDIQRKLKTQATHVLDGVDAVLKQVETLNDQVTSMRRTVEEMYRVTADRFRVAGAQVEAFFQYQDDIFVAMQSTAEALEYQLQREQWNGDHRVAMLEQKQLMDREMVGMGLRAKAVRALQIMNMEGTRECNKDVRLHEPIIATLVTSVIHGSAGITEIFHATGESCGFVLEGLACNVFSTVTLADRRLPAS